MKEGLFKIYMRTAETGYEITIKNVESNVQDLAIHVKNSSGRNLRIEYVETKTETHFKIDVAFHYSKPHVPKKVDFLKHDAKSRLGQNAARYVLVYGKYWEQMSMNIRSVIALCGQAKIGGRRVVQPFVEDSSFGPKGHSLGLYFNLSHMKGMLKANQFATLADKEEYDKECSLANSSHVTVHFLYDAENAAQFTKNKFRLSEQQYDQISNDARRKGWVECSFIGQFIKEGRSSKYFCVDPTVLTEWSVLERDVVRGAKCLTIVVWRGIGNNYRSHFKEKHLKVTSRDIQFNLKPNVDIENEVERFKRAFLRRRYIAVHVRGEKVVQQHSLDRLRKCIRLLTEVIQTVKESSHISQVLVATDMSNFGSGAWTGLLRGVTHEDNTLKDLNDSVVSNIGGVVYKPKEDLIDRGVVALVEMTLISQAQHFIAIGTGSFQEWVEAKFLEYHRDDARTSWSLIKLCSK